MNKDKIEIFLFALMALTSGIAYFLVPDAEATKAMSFILSFISGGCFMYSFTKFIRL